MFMRSNTTIPINLIPSIHYRYPAHTSIQYVPSTPPNSRDFYYIKFILSSIIITFRFPFQEYTQRCAICVLRLYTLQSSLKWVTLPSRVPVSVLTHLIPVNPVDPVAPRVTKPASWTSIRGKYSIPENCKSFQPKPAYNQTYPEKLQF